MGLIDDGVGPGTTDRLVAVPIEIRVLHHALDHECGAVTVVEREIIRLVADRIAVKGIVPLQLALDLLRIGIEKQLVGIEAVAVGRIVRSMGAIAVDRAGTYASDIARPDVAFALGKRKAGDLRSKAFLSRPRRANAAIFTKMPRRWFSATVGRMPRLSWSENSRVTRRISPDVPS